MKRRGLLLILIVALAPLAVAEQPPRAEIYDDGHMVVSGLPEILGDQEVMRHLSSGLTTTFSLRAEIKGAKLVGGARVDVRYELWDEVYQAVAVGIDGRGERRDFDDLEALLVWWHERQLLVFEGQEGKVAQGDSIALTLDVVPFSQSEKEDTQRWFSRSFAATRGGESARITDSAERRGDSLEKVLGVLMATSIQRRAVLSHEWTVAVTGGQRE